MSQVNVAYFFSSSDSQPIKHTYLRDAGSLAGAVMKNSGAASDENPGGLESGWDTQAALDKLVETADVIILFLSIEFRKSDFFTAYENKIRQKFDGGRAEVILVYLTIHDVESNSPLYSLNKNFFPSKYEAVNQGAEDDRLRKWTNFSIEIRAAVERVRSKKEKSRNPVFEFAANLCNRTIQRNQIRSLINRRAAASAKKAFPLVLFVHGSPEENLDNYRDRMKQTELKKILNAGKVHVFQDILWSKKAYDLNDISEYLCQGLSNRLFEHPSAGKAEIEAKLAEPPLPLMVSYRMDTAHWKNVETDEGEKEPVKIIEEFLDFWNRIEIANAEIQIIVCLFFEYNRAKRPGDEANYKTANLSARRFFSRKERPERDLADYAKFRLPDHWFPKHAKLPEKLEDEIERFENLFGIILDELPPVSLSDVNEWSIERDTQNAFLEVCPQHFDRFCNAEALMKAVEKYYEEEDPDDKGLPMKRLTEILVEKFEELRCRA